jgi:hypothetical protein
MELLLNLLWLMLALPAVLIWRQDLTSARISGRFCRSRSFLLLSCLLALLFPIVSVTDDLHATRAEMEESSPSKRVVKQSPGAKATTWSNAGGSPAQQSLHIASCENQDETLGLVLASLAVLPPQAVTSAISSRGPPRS